MDVTRETERDKQEFTDALNHCLDLLRANNYITDLNTDMITRKAAVTGQEMYECLKRIRDRSRTIVSKANSVPILDIHHERDHLVRNVLNPVNQIHYIKEEPPEIIENDETESYEDDGEKKITVKDVKTLEDSDDFDLKRPGSDEEDLQNGEISHRIRFNRSKRRRKPYARIPIEEKIRVVNLARSNPNWTLNWLKEKSGSQRLSSIIQLRQWEKQVMQNSTILDKLNVINGWVYSKYLQEKEKNSDVSNSMLRDWANEASLKFVYPRFKFEPNDAWIAAFKKIHGIRSGDIYED